MPNNAFHRTRQTRAPLKANISSPLPPSPCARVSSHRRLDFLPSDHDETDLCRTATKHQASAHAEATDCAVALHINVWRFNVVFLQASLNPKPTIKL
jgi:hypothetical protein